MNAQPDSDAGPAKHGVRSPDAGPIANRRYSRLPVGATGLKTFGVAFRVDHGCRGSARIRGIVAAVLAFAAVTASGNGLRLPSQDAFATGRGEAFVATANNPSAIYYNPAGIAQLSGLDVRAGVYGIYLDPSFSPPPPADTNTYHIDNKLAGVPQLFGTYTPANLPLPLTFGLGLYAPYGGGMSWPENTGFRAVATEGALTYLAINPVLALKVTPNFFIGAGLTANYGHIDLAQGLLRTATPFANEFRFSGDTWALGYNVGVLWRPHQKISLGASFRSSTAMSMEGHTEIEQQPIIPATERVAQADFTFPLTVVAGISWRPSPKWNLELNADYTDWSSFGTVTIEQASPPFPIRQRVPLTLNWQDSWMYEFGVTRYFENHWHVSAGYAFNQNSVPDDYYTPLAADLDRHFFTAGVGLKGRRFDLDLAYQFGYGPPRTVAGSTPSSTPGRFVGQNADGTYEFLSHALLISIGLHF